MKKQAVRWAITLVLLAGLMAALWPQPAEAAPSRWRFQSIWVPSITLWKGDKYWVDLMNVMAAGDLDIKWFAGGTLVTRSDEMFDAVAKGTIEAGTDWPSYWEGKNTAFGLITSTPVWLTPGDYMIWFWQAGGLELSQELYAKYGIVWFPHSVTGPESGQRSNKIFEAVARLNRDRGTPILLVEQNAQLALQAAHLGYVLETGRVVLRGAGAELLADPAVRSAYLGL